MREQSIRGAINFGSLGTKIPILIEMFPIPCDKDNEVAVVIQLYRTMGGTLRNWQSRNWGKE